MLYYFTVLEVGTLQWIYKAEFLWEKNSLGEICFLPYLFQFEKVVCVPWLMATFLHFQNQQFSILSPDLLPSFVTIWGHLDNPG